MIQSIEITIGNNLKDETSAIILPTKNICYINNNKYKISELYLNNLLQIIYLWKNEYGNDNIIDSEEFLIKIETKDNVETFHGKGIFPYNYQELKELLGDINGK